jgi:hypothetical protein
MTRSAIYILDLIATLIARFILFLYITLTIVICLTILLTIRSRINLINFTNILVIVVKNLILLTINLKQSLIIAVVTIRTNIAT